MRQTLGRRVAKRSGRLTPCAWFALLTALLAPGVLRAETAPAAEAEREPTQAEIEAWLKARALPDTRDEVTSSEEAPPPPPRARGLVLEAGLGAMGYLGTLKHVSPTSPLLHLQLGYEVFDWAMVFVEGDLAYGSTGYANPPPQPRAYSFYGFGGGVRFTVRPTERFGLYLQGSIGAAEVSDDVLIVYGYRSADELSPYYGALLGAEWYQVSPHLALAVSGGVRNYDAGLSRLRSSETELAWLGLVSLRYAF
ncbi:MAG: hypothetical protein KIT72_01295 [Polyangiaceae bacterium]|nr:hypothetical protein [Polyangiaceae bacterium]MCW5789031.1 hypothetical protein [Polyangiaceae bacterium]